jgi:hypothetical protein
LCDGAVEDLPRGTLNVDTFPKVVEEEPNNFNGFGGLADLFNSSPNVCRNRLAAYAPPTPPPTISTPHRRVWESL